MKRLGMDRAARRKALRDAMVEALVRRQERSLVRMYLPVDDVRLPVAVVDGGSGELGHGPFHSDVEVMARRMAQWKCGRRESRRYEGFWR